MRATSKRPRLVHRPAVVGALSSSTTHYLRLVALSGRFEHAFDPETVAMLARGEPGVAVFWHQRLLGIPELWRRLQQEAGVAMPWSAMVSRHGDGELIARTLERFGGTTLRGSTRRGGAQVARAGLAALNAGHCVAVVGDGPRGPHGTVHPGALFLARVSGRPVVPLSFAVDRALQARSWDRLLVPLPFSRGIVLVGAPIFVPPDADSGELARLTALIARRLEAMAIDADAKLGVVRAGAGAPLGRA